MNKNVTNKAAFYLVFQLIYIIFAKHKSAELLLMHIKSYFIAVIMTILPLVGTQAQDTHDSDDNKYTINQPLIYEDIWDLPPYTFLNKDGEPNGFNVDLIKIILKRLDIPYIIRLKPTADAYNDLKEGRSDLMLGMLTDYHSQFADYGTSVVGLFTHGIAHPKHSHPQIKTAKDLNGHKFVMQRNSVSHRYMVTSGLEKHAIPSDDINDAILRVAAKDSGEILWNTLSLEYTIRKYDLDNFEITPVYIPNGEYRFMSRDKRLLEMIDSVYEIMAVNDELTPIRRKWFYPQVKQSGIPEFTWYIAGGLSFIILMLIIYNAVYRFRENSVNRINDNLTKRLSLYVLSCKILMWAYDVEREKFITYTSEGEVLDEYTKLNFSVFFNHDDFITICNALRYVQNNPTQTKTIQARCHKPSTPDNEHYFDMIISVHRRKHGKVSMLLVTQHNVTEERQKYIEQRNTQLKFQTVFYAVNIDMGLFDSKGDLIDLNQNAMRTLKTDRTTMKQINIKDLLVNSLGMDMTHPETVHATALIKPGVGLGTITHESIRYYEYVIQPIYYKDKLIRFFVTGRDMTEMAENSNRERRNEQLIKEGIERQKEYVRNINYDLEVSNSWLTQYYPTTKMVEITHDPHMPTIRLSQIRCLRMLDESCSKDAMRLMNSMDRYRAGKFDIKLSTIFTDEKQRKQHLHLTGIPIFDTDGKIDHYYGLCRNISEIEETERQLKLEMLKARNAETVKNSFVKNMSYEIRTPLNAVMGFAELFETDHAPEDEPIFMDEIKKNSALLLNIINDILQISRIDSNMIEMTHENIDFAEIFDSHCLSGWTHELKEGVNTIIENHYEHLVVDIDANHLGQVIEIVTANAAHFTHSGSISAKYEYHHGELTVSVEDSGVGISKDVLDTMFQQAETFEDVDHCCIRLKLLICKRLVEKMGGHLDLESELGHGTTVWITIPCKAITIKKKNILT